MHLLTFATPILASLTSLVAADFHVFNCAHSYGLGNQQELQAAAVALPSNKYDCNGVRSSPSIEGLPSLYVSKSTETWNVVGLCGAKKIDAYYNSGRNEFDLYYAGGDGKVIGSCYQQSAGVKMSCSAAFDLVTCVDDWVCLTNVCN